VLMAYDEHGPTWSHSGPIGGLPWVEDSVDAILKAGVPASLLDLGVAGYGYTWPGDGSDGTQLSVAAVRILAGDLDRYNAEQGEWSATLPDGTVVWWSDAESLAARRALAARLHLHGIAVWEISLSDPLQPSQ
jgi:spore germination protein